MSLFNAHYDERCFLPIHIYEGGSGKPVAMILREGKTPSGTEVRTILKHVVARIRGHWPKVRILVRGDGHYGRPRLQLLGGQAKLCWMSGNPEMGDPSAVVPEDDHHVQHLKCSADDDEHIDGGNRLHMLFQESAPAWRGCAGTPRHIFSNGCLPYADPKLEEFTMDA